MNGKKLLSYYVENNFLDKFLSSIHRREKSKTNPKFLRIKLRHNINNKNYLFSVINIIITKNLPNR